MNPFFDLSGKVALVSGGSSGLGLAIAEGLLQQGARVYIASRKPEALAAAVEQLSKVGPCVGLQADLSDGEGSKALAARFAEQETRLDILVNNAGNSWGAPLESFPDEAWNRVMNLNVRGVFNLTRDLLPLLRAAASPRSPARVINIGSVAGIISSSLGAYSYGASKAAVHQLTRNLAREFAEHHINVNAIAPGRFPSRLTRHLTEDSEAYAADCRMIPLGRFGEPEEIAALAVSLASTAGAYMTGAIIPIDGGASLMA
ncbi:SDR family oxidoreductase [Aestuariirhabdus litorea]|uniref:SDR family oxidoreductase n=1 Tax=Aestuariirhabdus litorea TaxID=2528527 RepID=A0A3P3VJC5_9GAMM|nr:SDR family oxidoreductase [Aestuariirhabdus litorea]RRJ82851.1 SDR family oxidoreductase [Aestuariirhabdus litorea]RWW93011.1 SDR family oxidoreductase [Endozoicomonadaceae bacterium GTF-13]